MSLNKVKEFHEKFGCAIGESLNNKELVKHRASLIFEEAQEAINALGYSLYWDSMTGKVGLFRSGKPDKLNLIKELADLEYVTKGAAIAFGLPHEEAFNRVHANNLSKIFEDGTIKKTAEGKVLKPPTYKPVDLSDLVKED